MIASASAAGISRQLAAVSVAPRITREAMMARSGASDGPFMSMWPSEGMRVRIVAVDSFISIFVRYISDKLYGGESEALGGDGGYLVVGEAGERVGV